jgi:hypothetical protein
VRRYPPLMSIKYMNGYLRSHNSQSRNKRRVFGPILALQTFFRTDAALREKGRGFRPVVAVLIQSTLPAAVSVAAAGRPTRASASFRPVPCSTLPEGRFF